MMTSAKGNIFRVTGHFCGNSPVPGDFPAQRQVTRSFDVFCDLRLNKRLKQSRGWWFVTLSRPLWRHCNVASVTHVMISSGIGLLPNRRQEITQKYAGMLPIEPWEKINGIWFKLQKFLSKIHLKMPSAKCRPFCSIRGWVEGGMDVGQRTLGWRWVYKSMKNC